MKFDTSQADFQRLSRLVRHSPESLVPFVGAGLSIYGPENHRMPLWSQLVDILLERGKDRGLINSEIEIEIRHLLKNNQQITAIDRLVECLDLPSFRQIVTEALSIEGKHMPPAIEKMVEMTWTLIITTNLDRFIEEAWHKKKGVPLRVATHDEPGSIMEAVLNVHGQNVASKSLLAKIHGSIEKPDSWVLTSKNYQDIVGDGNSAYSDVLRTILLKNVLFVGFGLSDYDLDILIEQIRKNFPYGVGDKFALLSSDKKSDNRVVTAIRELGVRPIWYEVCPHSRSSYDSGHGQVQEFMSSLVEDWTESIVFDVKWIGFPKTPSNLLPRLRATTWLSSKITAKNQMGVQVLGAGGAGKTIFVKSTLEDLKSKLIELEYNGLYGFSFNYHSESKFIETLYTYFYKSEFNELDNQQRAYMICAKLIQEKVVLVLDGAESVVSEPLGSFSLPVQRILTAASEGNSLVILTSRTKIHSLNEFEVHELSSLADLDSNTIGRIERSDERAFDQFNPLIDRLSKQHSAEQIPLGQSSDNIVFDLLSRSLNKLSRPELCLAQLISQFEEPLELDFLYEIALNMEHDSVLIREIQHIDIRQPLSSLSRKGLITSNGDDRLMMHPLVAQYVKDTTPHLDANQFHTDVLRYYIETSKNLEKPTNIAESKLWLKLCFHAANSQNWPAFDKAFFYDLNRQYKNYLGNVIGSWEEYYRLASMTISKGSKEPSIRPAYYLSSIARALKHLGKTQESKKYYKKCIQVCVREKHVETSRYVNNYLSLLTMSGNIEEAFDLIRLNFRSINWLSENWQKCWQEEYAWNSIGYLLALSGYIDEAQSYFDASKNVWNEREQPMQLFFDYYRVYESEIKLAKSFEFCDTAYLIAKKSRISGEKNGWLETQIVGLKSMAAAKRCQSVIEDKDEFLNDADELLKSAQVICEKASMPRSESLVLLECLRTLVFRYIYFDTKNNIEDDFSFFLEKLELIITGSRFDLLLPELFAARAWQKVMRNETHEAKVFCKKAEEISSDIGVLLFSQSQFYLLGSIKQKLELNQPVPNPNFERLDWSEAWDLARNQC